MPAIDTLLIKHRKCPKTYFIINQVAKTPWIMAYKNQSGATRLNLDNLSNSGRNFICDRRIHLNKN